MPVTPESAWARWLTDQLAERGWRQVDLVRHAPDSALSTPQVSRWMRRGETPTVDSVRATCAALRIPAVDGLLAAGVLQPEDLGTEVVERPARGAHALRHGELLEEIARRLERVPDVPGAADTAVVHTLERTSPTPTEGSQWAARRRQP